MIVHQPPKFISNISRYMERNRNVAGKYMGEKKVFILVLENKFI